MPRLLPALLVAYVLGLLAGDLFAPPVEPLGVAIVALLGLAALGRRRPWLRVALLLAVVATTGVLAMATRLAVAPVQPVDDVTVDGRIAGTRRGPGGWSAELHDVHGVELPEPGGGLPTKLLLHGRPALPEGPAFDAYVVGERVRTRVRLRPPRGMRNPGGRDEARRLRRRGVGAVGRLVHPALHVAVEEPGGRGGSLGLARSRQRAARRLAERGEGGALLAALALGERGGLTPETRQALVRLGLSHLIAVSGLHLGLVAGGVYALARRALRRGARWAPGRDPRRGALLAALGAAALYAVLAGGGVPVRRALACLTALVTAFLARRPLPVLQPLCLAALAVLVADPASLFEPGPQMSFAATAGLLCARRLAGPGPPGREALGASAAAIAVTLPLSAHHFGRAPAAGLLANGLAVPWSGLVLLPGSLAAAALALLASPGEALDALLDAAARPAEWSLAAARIAAGRLPSPGLPATPSPVASGLAALCAGLALAATRLRVRLALVVLASLALDRLPPAPLFPLPPRVVFLDVGQGDAALIQGRRGALLVDGGTRLPGGVDHGRSVVLPALAALGVTRLDVVVASHADLDHRGGLLAVLETLPVAALWLPHGGVSDPGFGALIALARERRVAVREAGAGDAPVAIGDLHVQSLWPPRGAAGSSNDRSLVLRVEVAGRRVLLPGDLEAAGEVALLARGVGLDADVLKLPHHGSRTSTTPAFLAAVAPAWAVASAPRAGRFGMPHAEVVARLDRAGVGLAWTGRDGAVLVDLSRERGRGSCGWASAPGEASEALRSSLRVPSGVSAPAPCDR